MMNKKAIQRIISSIAVTLVFTVMVSCNKWLDVRPSNQFDENEQFSTEQGYIDALIGTYQAMTNEATYGAELSFRFVDVLAQLYGNKSSGTDYYRLSATYAYTQINSSQHSPRTVIENIWSAQYNAVAQLNYLLKHLDTKPAELTEARYRLIKGEALALRAFLHFDLLRLFAPAYSEEAAEQQAIPYVTAFTVSPGDVLTFTAVIDRMGADLQEAISLQSEFQEMDQIIDNQGTTSSELFDMFKQNRMNYWAAKALLARIYLYIGDKPNAKKYADEVIDSEQFGFMPTANRIFDERSEDANIIFTQEHVFSLYHSRLRDVADNFFKTTALNPEASDLFNTRAVLDGIYETSVEGLGTDIRSSVASPSRWSEYNSTVVYTKKYYSDHAQNANQRLIPLIRLPEMYYIAAEASPTIDEALEYLNEVREARNISLVLTSENVADEIALQNELFKEYRKEYYGEGHLWYFYKRLAYTSLPNTVFFGTMASVYTFPIPDGELEFNPGYN